ncbi:hypothetical protein VP01_2262g2 [Puccinia sorghi]|uniref:intramembrane prenyl-peptidase Rce1 n=1 Tax=Puccinia sorghi TaxID=27349 RepID=A0A0L6V8H6_9BASI|nr:hypothetical protein VP01_2262g2 [Puccinia sorghi]
MPTHSSLTLPVAHAASAFAACSYVAVLYLFRSTRTYPLQLDPLGRRLDRLHPDILRARLCAVSLSSFASLALVGLLARTCTSSSTTSVSVGESVHQTLLLTGLKTAHIQTPWEYARLWMQPVVLTAILFWGVLYTLWFLEPSSTQVESSFSLDIYLLRALVLGPFCEEVVFRACVLAFHLLVHPANQLSKFHLIFATPLWFGFAHVHGVWETYRSLGATRHALKLATMQTTVQFIYTTIFGWYAAFIYLRTGSVISATLCHSFCNYMGLPPIFEAMQRFPHKRSCQCPPPLPASFFLLFLGVIVLCVCADGLSNLTICFRPLDTLVAIVFHYLIGVFGFAFLVHRWATQPRIFPSSPPFWP